ncbi:hypothetical protein P872_21590 [Rhodonellum psychrophilum GCM71 = DSM 17998]|uniref:Molybdopterin molybdenumtransferase n=2 Tax=Rhodonellum TaxID=336827 RepID=U5BJ72_9BACT|nr:MULTISPECIES: gephyrin-like molybdotransferase Glp [Rhodonellum]ERM80470.1 hypothetical protein P872_21590 [Rhodonellum psychrophilum GCM71 = DSM 17998]SDZ57882.1 molybdopterin molybdochelatase [Rhodonellum ikkaensis]
MISVQEAKEILFKHLPEPKIITVKLEDAVGLVLAEDLAAPLDVPSFDNSAMDGYAFSFEDCQNRLPMVVKYTIPAGTVDLPELQSGEAARIFTGAPIPKGCDTVVMQELTSRKDDFLSIEADTVKKGDHIRKQASQTSMGDQVAQVGWLLKPAMIGFLAGLGFDRVSVFRPPNVTILTSGKELVSPGNPLGFGQVYESSSYTLKAALREMGIPVTSMPIVEDDLVRIQESIETALGNSDILLVTGGISVGDFDFVNQAFKNLGVEQLFYKIRQKPGKPLFAGKRENQLVFGLPGNPGSTLTCFYQYVKPSILKIMGKEAAGEKPQLVSLEGDFQKRLGLTHFVKGLVSNQEVKVLSDQESYKMNAFAQSNCLIEFEETKEMFVKGDLVRVHFLD